MTTNMLVTMERYEQLQQCITELEQQTATADALLLDAACQGGLLFTAKSGKRCIDTCALSTWEDVCCYLAERGRLKRINDRMYELVDDVR